MNLYNIKQQIITAYKHCEKNIPSSVFNRYGFDLSGIDVQLVDSLPSSDTRINASSLANSDSTVSISISTMNEEKIAI